MTGKDLKGIENGETLTLRGKVYNIRIDFNVICDLEEKYGSYVEALNAFGRMSMKDIRFLFYEIIKQEEPDITEEKAGKLVDINNLNDVIEALTKAMQGAVPEGKKEESPREI